MTSYPAPKRALDLVVGLALVLVLVPVIVAVVVVMGFAMIVVRADRGPWLYRELRISRGSEFELLKFRTLRRDVLDSVAGGEAHSRLHEREPENLTWAGRRVLKPWYLDELPQVWNVLRGEMSLVGPRPWPPSMVESQVANGFTYRNDFVAGWTGPAQVQKGAIESAGYTHLDLAYVERCRKARGLELMRLDLSYLWRTVVVIAKGEGLRF